MERKQLENVHKEALAEITNLKKQNEDLKNRNANLQTENTNLLEQISNLEAQLNTRTEEKRLRPLADRGIYRFGSYPDIDKLVLSFLPIKELYTNRRISSFTQHDCIAALKYHEHFAVYDRRTTLIALKHFTRLKSVSVNIRGNTKVTFPAIRRLFEKNPNIHKLTLRNSAWNEMVFHKCTSHLALSYLDLKLTGMHEKSLIMFLENFSKSLKSVTLRDVPAFKWSTLGASYPNVHQLYLRMNGLKASENLGTFISKFPALQELSLRTHDPKSLTLPHLSNLTELTISADNVTNLQNILKSTPNLRSLSLTQMCNGMGPDTYLPDIGQLCPQLTDLSLYVCSMLDNLGIAIQHCVNLEALFFCILSPINAVSNALNDLARKNIVFEKLRELEFDETRINVEDFCEKVVKIAPNLRRLRLDTSHLFGMTKVGVEGFKTLACLNLEELKVRYSQIGCMNGLSLLFKDGLFPNLRKLYVCGVDEKPIEMQKLLKKFQEERPGIVCCDIYPSNEYWCKWYSRGRFIRGKIPLLSDDKDA